MLYKFRVWCCVTLARIRRVYLGGSLLIARAKGGHYYLKAHNLQGSKFDGACDLDPFENVI